MGILNFPNTNLKYAVRDAALVSFVLIEKDSCFASPFVCFIAFSGFFYTWVIVCCFKGGKGLYSCGCAALIP